MSIVRSKLGGLIAAVVVVSASCTSGGQPAPRGSTSPIPRGGTLRVRLVNFAPFEQPITTPKGTFDVSFDPAVDFSPTVLELYRCCLLRTLLSYNGSPTAQGGAELRPDLAVAMPQVSDDLLTWVFHLKPGLHYGPPFQETEIKAQDFVRVTERQLRPAPPPIAAAFGSTFLGLFGPSYLDLFVGAKDFADGKTDHIGGLQVPDDHTLIVRLTHPSGDVPYLFSIPASAPLPPGASDGHDVTYGRFLVSSGPYMFQGSENLDFSLSPKDQKPVSGYVPGKSITLVRNPSWSPSTDALRKAYVDRMEFVMGGTAEAGYRDVLAGKTDLVLDGVPSAAVFDQARSAPSGERRVYTHPDDVVMYLSFNVATPPFDDVHVRKAVSYAIDKSVLRELAASEGLGFMGPFGGQIAGHPVPDSFENNILLNYDPYPHRLANAKAEMAMSPYDRNHDGICDAPACAGVYAVSRRDEPFFPKQAAAIRDDLKEIGIDLKIDTFPDGSQMYQKAGDPRNKVPMILGLRYSKDFPNASSFFRSLLSSESIGNGSNLFLVGATPEQLAGWGYSVTSVPSVDAKIDECLPKFGQAQTTCWAELDQVVMERVVPYVPYLFGASATIASSRVLNLTYDQFADLTALDQIALIPG